jgi:hypothetical protein
LYFYNTVNMYGTPSWVGKLEYSSVLPVLEAKSSNQEASEPEVELKQIFHLRKNANFVYMSLVKFCFHENLHQNSSFFPIFANSSIFSQNFGKKAYNFLLASNFLFCPTGLLLFCSNFRKNMHKTRNLFHKTKLFCANLPKNLMSNKYYSR